MLQICLQYLLRQGLQRKPRRPDFNKKGKIIFHIKNVPDERAEELQRKARLPPKIKNATIKNCGALQSAVLMVISSLQIVSQQYCCHWRQKENKRRWEGCLYFAL
jgi:hypothetical protein